jgi:hypothetical protein
MDPQFFLNVPSKKRRHSSTYSNNILFTIAKDNNIIELEGFLKRNVLLANQKIKKIL